MAAPGRRLFPSDIFHLKSRSTSATQFSHITTPDHQSSPSICGGPLPPFHYHKLCPPLQNENPHTLPTDAVSNPMQTSRYKIPKDHNTHRMDRRSEAISRPILDDSPHAGSRGIEQRLNVHAGFDNVRGWTYPRNVGAGLEGCALRFHPQT